MKKNIKNPEYKKKEAGFTIVETLVAISILTIALTGPLAIVAQSLRTSFYARDQVVAYYLAQEAIEYIRNERDNNSLEDGRVHTGWLDGISVIGGTDRINAPGAETHKLYLERGPGGYVLKACSSVCPNMKYADPANPNNNVNIPYGQDALLPDSKFIREIILNRGLGDTEEVAPVENREVLVTARVKWSTPTGEKSVVIRETIFNWQIEDFETE